MKEQITNEETIGDLGYIKLYAQTLLNKAPPEYPPLDAVRRAYLLQIINLADGIYKRHCKSD